MDTRTAAFCDELIKLGRDLSKEEDEFYGRLGEGQSIVDKTVEDMTPEERKSLGHQATRGLLGLGLGGLGGALLARKMLGAGGKQIFKYLRKRRGAPATAEEIARFGKGLREQVGPAAMIPGGIVGGAYGTMLGVDSGTGRFAWEHPEAFAKYRAAAQRRDDILAGKPTEYQVTEFGEED